MSASTDRIKKYIGVGADALAYAMGKVSQTEDKTEAAPPVGAKAEYKAPPTGAGAIAGLSTGTIVLLVLMWYLFKK